MEKTNIVTKQNIDRVKKFLKEAIDWAKNANLGCKLFPLSKKLMICVGWEGNHTVDEAKAIHFPADKSYCAIAGIKVKDSTGYSNYKDFKYPVTKSGEIISNKIVLDAEASDKSLETFAKWFLDGFVYITNGYNDGFITLEFSKKETDDKYDRDKD